MDSNSTSEKPVLFSAHIQRLIKLLSSSWIGSIVFANSLKMINLLELSQESCMAVNFNLIYPSSFLVIAMSNSKEIFNASSSDSTFILLITAWNLASVSCHGFFVFGVWSLYSYPILNRMLMP